MMANQLGLRSPKCLTKIAEASKVQTSGRPFDLLRSTDDFGPKATCSRVQMMANQLGLRSPKCLTKIAETSKVETSGGLFYI